MATRLAAVSGGQRDVFDEMFWAGVTHKSPEGYPLQGSVGVAYHPFKDLKTLADIEDVEKEYVNKADPLRPDLGAPLGRRHSVAVKQYFKFCEDMDQPFFFIKKGGVALWLVRKTSGYVYEPRDVPHWACHRIHFTFVRVATKEEGERRTGVNARSLYWMECSTPLAMLMAGEPEPKTAPPPTEKDTEDPMLSQGKVVRKRKMAAPAGTKTLEEVVEAATVCAAGGAGAGAGAAAAAAAAAASPDGTEISSVSTVAEPPKPKRTRKKKAAAAPAAASVTQTPTAPPTTTQTILSDYSRPAISLTPSFLEAKESPLSVERVEVLKIKLFEHDGTTYYHEGTKNKLYKRMPNGSIGPYHGRWNPHSKVIDLREDTDEEEDASTRSH
jgi:hypothetical protein